MSTRAKHIMLIAGEASGDRLGANLARSLLRHEPSCSLSGMGSTHMREAGVSVFFDASDLAIIGGLDALTRVHMLFSAKRTIEKQFASARPDLLVLIDYPGFNLRIAKLAKRMGIRVLFYVSPQIWAWRFHRIHTIRQYVDHMAVLFPFEEKIYQKAFVPVTYVGHPLVDQAPRAQIRPENTAHRRVGLFPGSRPNEIARHLPDMLAAVQMLQATHADVECVLSIAHSIDRTLVDTLIPKGMSVTYHAGLENLPYLDCALTVSGTVTLELALREIPMLILYRMDKLSYWIAKYLLRLKIETIGLCNIVAEEKIVKEFVQTALTPTALAEEAARLLTDTNYQETMRTKLRAIRHNLIQTQPASERVTELVLKLLAQDDQQFYSFSAL